MPERYFAYVREPLPEIVVQMQRERLLVETVPEAVVASPSSSPSLRLVEAETVEAEESDDPFW